MKKTVTYFINYRIALHQEFDNILCKVCGKILDSMDTFKRHWKNLYIEDTTNQYPYGYQSPRQDTFRIHLSRHYSKVCTNNTEKTPRPNVLHKLETRPYQDKPISVASYLYQQTKPKNKEPFSWKLQELDAPQPRISRPYNTEELIIIPLKATKQLPNPRGQHYLLCEVLEAFHDTT